MQFHPLALFAFLTTVTPEPPKRTFGFLGMVGFQWINPKAWLMSLAVTTACIAPDAGLVALLAVIAGMFALMTLPCMSA